MPIQNPDQQLHDKATRGEPLNPEEQARLEAWYAQLDQAERAQLAGKPSAEPLAKLRAQVEEATAELLRITQRVQILTRENDKLREEIIQLQGQLTRHSTAQPA